MIEVADDRDGGWSWFHNRIIDDYGSRIGPYGIAVYAALARHANRQRASWPSYDKLAAELGMSKRKVIDVCKELEKLRLITIETQQRTDGGDWTNRFTLCPVQAVHPAGESGARGGVHHMHRGGAPHAPKQDSGIKNQSEQEESVQEREDRESTHTHVREQKAVGSLSPVPKSVSARAPADAPEFKTFSEAFRELFPRRNGVHADWDLALGKLRLISLDDWPDVLRAARNYSRSPDVLAGFAKHAHNWLDDWRSWLDYQPPEGSNERASSKLSDADKRRATAERRAARRAGGVDRGDAGGGGPGGTGPGTARSAGENLAAGTRAGPHRDAASGIQPRAGAA